MSPALSRNNNCFILLASNFTYNKDSSCWKAATYVCISADMQKANFSIQEEDFSMLIDDIQKLYPMLIKIFKSTS